MPPTRATETHHQILKGATLVLVHAGLHQRRNTGEELMHGLLLIQIIDNRRIFARERFEAFFPPRIRQAAGIEDESAAMPTLVLRQSPVKRKAYDPHVQLLCAGSHA